MSSALMHRFLLRHPLKQLNRRQICTNHVQQSAKQHLKSRRTEKQADVLIPTRIKREPTDILQAIATTVKKDFSNPSYKYIDDPETIPTSSISKKAYSLAKASGKRAAQYVIKKYPRYFEDNPADPTIEAFMPPLTATLDESTPEGLQERIELRLVEEAFASYKKCTDAGVELSEELVCDLLELLCVYNSENAPDILLPEEQAFSRLVTPDKTRDRIRNVWNDNGSAETVFSGLKNPPNRAYYSLLRGRAKFFNVDKAMELFRDMTSQGIKLDLKSYNTVVGLAAFAYNRVDERVKFLRELFTSIQNDNLSPTLEIFNSALVTLARSSRFNPGLSGKFASSILSEMLACGIEPSLGTWYHILRIFYYNDDIQCNILEEIIDRLEGTALLARHPDDLEFFSAAMVKCAINLKDLELATRIDDLLNFDQNYKLIGDTFKEGVYYNFYLKTLCMFEQIDAIMEQFDKIVPHSFSPTFNSLDDLFEALELNEGYEYLPKVWSDLHSLSYDRNVEVTEKAAKLMAKRKHPEQLQSQMHQLLSHHYETILGEIDFMKEKETLSQVTVLPMVSAPLLSYMIQVALDAGELMQADDIFSLYVEYKSVIKGNFVEKSAVSLVSSYIKRKDVDQALEVLKVMSSFAHSSLDVTADRVQEELDLSEESRTSVDELL